MGCVSLQDSFLSLQHCFSQYPLVEVVKLTIVAKSILLTNLQQTFFECLFYRLVKGYPHNIYKRPWDGYP